jgi:aminomethyltransferase
LNESINPMQAGLSNAVDLAGRNFPGRDVLASLDPTALPRRVGLRLAGRRPAREHSAVLNQDGQNAGVVTSGTYSPTLEQPIAMAYVVPSAASLGTQLKVDIRGKHEPAEVVPLPFYKRS